MVTDALELAKTPGGATAVAAVVAVVIRFALKIADSPLGGRVMDRVPHDVRPMIPALLGAIAAGADAYATGDMLHAVIVGLGSYTGSEVTYGMQRGRAKRLKARDALKLPPDAGG